MRQALSIKAHIVRFLLGFPFFAVWGTWLLISWMFGLGRKVRGERAALSDTFPCPHGHANPARGRFRCNACRGVYLGWIGECALCGKMGDRATCVRCGVTVLLPWR